MYRNSKAHSGLLNLYYFHFELNEAHMILCVYFFSFTCSYFAPEYFMHGIVDEKTDTFAFGVLLLELITGRPAVDHLQQSIVIWVTSAKICSYRH